MQEAIYQKVNGKNFQNYLDEFCYKLNRRTFGTNLFDRVVVAQNLLANLGILIYFAGLRISELTNLKIQDIDSNGMAIHIKGAKGKKGRMTLLSEKSLVKLKEYFKVYKPKKYLFEGQLGGIYSTRSIQEIVNKACRRTKIIKKATVHTLRQRGTDLRYIQVLLGHESSNATELYTHITSKGMGNVKSPFDKLDF